MTNQKSWLLLDQLKWFIPLILLLIVSTTLQAQEMIWKRIFNSGYNDYASSVCTDSTGNIIVTGTVGGTWVTIKYNANGDTLWQRWFRINTWGSAAYGVATDILGNIIVTGKAHTDSTDDDYCTVKYSPEGDIIWLRTLSTDSLGMGEAHSVAVDSKGNIIVTGTSQFPPAVTSSPDYVTVKYDSAGTLLWMRVYNYAYEDIARSVVVDDSDNIIVTGYSTDSSQSYNWDWCTMKYSPSGDTLWVKREDIGRDDRAYSITIDRSTNDVIVAGGLGNYGTIVKYDGITSNECWRKNFSWTGLLVGIATDCNRNIYFTSWYDPIPGGFRDFITVKCNSFGDTSWTAVYNGGYQDQAMGITVDKDANVIVSGGSYDGFPDSQPAGQCDYLTIKYSSTTGINDRNYNIFPQQFKLYQNYPNPFNESTVIRYEISTISNVNLKVYDILGREVTTLVNEQETLGRYSIQWKASEFPSGVYTYRITCGRYQESKKLILMK